MLFLLLCFWGNPETPSLDSGGPYCGEEQRVAAGHQGGPKCRCSECLRLKKEEDKWICRLGSFYGGGGLNTRDEIKARSRVNFVGT